MMNMMKKETLFPLAATAGGIVAFLLRFLQNRTGFEATTGLPVPGNIPGIMLVLFLLLMAAGLAAISPFDIMGYLYYPILLGVIAVLGILLRFPRKYA